MIKKQFLNLSVPDRADQIITILRKVTQGMVQPASATIVAQYGRDPFLVLISCLLSLRTKDTVSLPASQRLFEHARTPQQLLALPVAQIQSIIYPVGFYRRKAVTLHEVSLDLINRFGGKVPGSEAELLSLKGVGRKTANLVLGEGFGYPAICVDTHVHRLSNRLGLVTTTNPHDTELELKKILPRHYWTEYNSLLVMWGQNICVPLSPLCSKCPLLDLCPQVGVTRRR